MPALHTQSEQLAARAELHLPGGVNSPVRAFRAVGGKPILFQSASGCQMTDVDGNEYVDFVASWGPMILGHAHPRVIEAVTETARKGLSFGATCPLEIELAETIKSMVAGVDLIRLVSSGTEAVMSAIRVARGFTGRAGVVKFEGCYHGHSDCLLAKAGSGAMTLGLPDSAGVPSQVAAHTMTLPYNNLQAVEEAFAAHVADLAAVVIEPVAGNMGVVAPRPGYLEGLRELCTRHGVVLIFDEVMTGFRVAPGGAQERFGITADLVCLGKIVGGGLPLAAYGGRRDIMECVAPLGPVYQAGTLSGNPVAVAAGLATLRQLQAHPLLYERLEALGDNLASGLEEALQEHKIPGTIGRVGSMLTLFFTEGPVYDYPTAKTSDTARYARFFQGMLSAGYYLAPSQFEAAFLGAAHTAADIEAFLEAARDVLGRI